jgi:hypothetical protein
MAVPFPTVAVFAPKDDDLDHRLVVFQANVEKALRYLDLHKDDRYRVHTSQAPRNEASFGDLWVLATEGRAIDLNLPRVRAENAGARVAVLRTSAGHAVTVHAIGTRVNGASTATPATGSLVVYTTDGSEWWSP